jgi:hypothetical protein
MATRAEQLKAEQQKKGPKPKVQKKLAAKKAKGEHKKERIAKGEPHNAGAKAGKGATAALEPKPAAKKRPSRKSTRKSANRGRQDSNQILHAENATNASSTRASLAKVKAKRVRGSKA